jgi:hypothetical protein
MAFTNDWTVSNNPADHSKFKDIPSFVRKVRTDIEERLTDMVYGFATGETDYGIKQLLFKEQGSDPSAPTDAIRLYAKNDGTYAELYVRHENAGVIQLTQLGKVLVSALKLASGALGDLLYHDGTNLVRHAGNTTTTKKYLTQTGNGSVSAAPVWEALTIPVSVPTGAVLPYVSLTPPSGYLLCDGSAVSRTTYADLFTACGTVFGSGDGSTTFNLPNMTNKFPYGASDGGSAGNASVGSSRTAQTLANNDSAVAYSFTYPAGPTSGPSGPTSPYAGSTQDVMPPYLALAFIIKT